MISCTDFIFAYSELFSYLEEENGRNEVERFWEYLFKPSDTGIPLAKCVEKEGIRGCFTYWAGSLNEEAADFTMYLNEKAGWFMLKMHRCPSKGKLLELQEKYGFAPYHAYCFHCDHYRAAIEQMGLNYLYNFEGIDHASCQILIYDDKIFDGRIIVDDDTEIMDRRAGDNEYFHKEFHNIMNEAINYVGTKFGNKGIKKCLGRYAKKAYNKLTEEIKSQGLMPLKNEIERMYRAEKAADAVNVTQDDNSLVVTVKYCPAVNYLKQTGRIVSLYLKYTTEVVMETIAANSGLIFEMKSYDNETGAAEYTFVDERN